MFLYLIAFVAALITIFGLPSSRNSALLLLRNDEFPVSQEAPGAEGEEERFIKEGILSEGESEEAQAVSKSMDEMSDVKKNSTESFTFDYKARRFDSNPAEPEKHAEMVPQDMWNILNKIPVPSSEQTRHADYLYEALWEESMKVGTRPQENVGHNDNFNKTKIIDEATFEKMYEQQNRQVNNEDRKGHHLK
ncbi:uncharacterized protein LOC117175042 isoform X2 [Belonocnema kinseyi]|uniref:uncharacterized protein LOC117175042 isoform X2 n=1 Tax=Belonocnema kinseyi TaxID=2817044 RepID=UPI00143DECFB|nr:uncharacterized protein LOC117175042 isoform X2 [Belonocnema kinseyi]